MKYFFKEKRVASVLEGKAIWFAVRLTWDDDEVGKNYWETLFSSFTYFLCPVCLNFLTRQSSRFLYPIFFFASFFVRLPTFFCCWSWFWSGDAIFSLHSPVPQRLFLLPPLTIKFFLFLPLFDLLETCWTKMCSQGPIQYVLCTLNLWASALETLIGWSFYVQR